MLLKKYAVMRCFVSLTNWFLICFFRDFVEIKFYLFRSVTLSCTHTIV